MTDGRSIAAGSLVGGRYRVDALVGRGGMASVYRARDESLGRLVALKIIDSGPTDAEALTRQRNEIELLASLNHHALVTLFDASVDQAEGMDRTFLVMELVEGSDLAARIGQGPIGEHDIAAMTTDLADALYAIHVRGVVHRDIKPANVLLSDSHLPSQEFTAKLADLGIAHLIDSTRITSTGTVVGTAAYVSPEQALGKPATPASDVYSLGLVLLEAHTRVRAFPGTLAETLSARLARQPEVPGELGDEWKSLLTAMTARQPESRPTALEVAVAARALPETPDLAPAGDGDVTTVLTRVLPREGDEPTRVFPSAGGEPTQVLSNAEESTLALSTADEATRAMTAPATARMPADENRARIRPRRWMLVAAAVLVVAIAVTILVITLASPQGTTNAPTLPSVSGQLGTHLKQLMQNVTR
ncbi:MAG: Serine/threonine-protein kinase PknA [Microbacteriaceae bacterium]|nr:Serine/threonine-protein kinase PknA [Microbacteriaceae bacterium]